MTDQSAIVVQHGGFISPVADVTTALRRYQSVKEFISGVLREGVDYGKVPGSDKPTLLKPGAEKMTAFFGFTVRFILVEAVKDWTGEHHNGEPFFSFEYRAQLWRGDQLVAEGDGSCNSWEKKYRYRSAERTCPNCGKATIIKGKEEYGGGWLCFAKKGGCGSKFKEKDPAIIEQQLGQVKNPDPADLVNTIQKMAQKRALIAPVLIATNTSEYFTQDIEDYIDGTFEPVHSQVTEPPVSAPAETPAPAETQIMPLDQAENVTNKDGARYGDLDSETLSNMTIGIGKALNKPGQPQEKIDEYLFKRDAIKVILAHRNNEETK
jgi:hypothetical protein